MDLTPSSPLSHEVSLFNESGVNLPCVGSIISSYLILTLASCLYRNGNGNGWNKLIIKTKGGNGQNSNLKLEEEDQIRRVSRIIFHPDSKNDLAILVLDKNLNSGVKLLPIFGISNANANKSTLTNFSGRLCRKKFTLSLLQISDASHCSLSSFESDKLCLLPLDSNEPNSSCSRPFPGSSLICADEERGKFLCGILALSPENKGTESGQMYTNITSHLKWIESVSAEAKAEKSSCGGFIKLDREQEILYKVPENLRGRKSVCVWVVATTVTSELFVTVLTDPQVQFQSPESTLFGRFDFKINDTTYWNLLNTEKTWIVKQPFLVLYFRTNSLTPNSGFHIHLKEKTGGNETQKAVKYLELTPTSTDDTAQEFKYPQPPASTYKNDERTVIILKPATRHGKLKLDLKTVDTEKGYDWMDILSVESEPVSKFRFDGQGLWSDKSFEAAEDEPFLIYFHSDQSNTGAGFKFSYSEQRKRELNAAFEVCSESTRAVLEGHLNGKPTPVVILSVGQRRLVKAALAGISFSQLENLIRIRLNPKAINVESVKVVVEDVLTLFKGEGIVVDIGAIVGAVVADPAVVALIAVGAAFYIAYEALLVLGSLFKELAYAMEARIAWAVSAIAAAIVAVIKSIFGRSSDPCKNTDDGNGKPIYDEDVVYFNCKDCPINSQSSSSSRPVITDEGCEEDCEFCKCPPSFQACLYTEEGFQGKVAGVTRLPDYWGNQECTKIRADYQSSSSLKLNPDSICMRLYENEDCTGAARALYPALSPTRNFEDLASVNFKRKAKSFSACSSMEIAFLLLGACSIPLAPTTTRSSGPLSLSQRLELAQQHYAYNQSTTTSTATFQHSPFLTFAQQVVVETITVSPYLCTKTKHQIWEKNPVSWAPEGTRPSSWTKKAPNGVSEWIKVNYVTESLAGSQGRYRTKWLKATVDEGYVQKHRIAKPRPSLPKAVTDNLQLTDCYDSGHILAHSLGGPSDKPWNFFPQNPGFNSGVWSSVEKGIKAALLNGVSKVTLEFSFQFQDLNNIPYGFWFRVYDNKVPDVPSGFYYNPESTVRVGDVEKFEKWLGTLPVQQ